jgi:excisionase family DNA binding protein
MERVLTFDQLPKAVTMLTNEVSELKRLLIEQNEQSSSNLEQLLTIEETSRYLNLSVPTIYTKVSKREIPFMKRGKRLYFSSSELFEYIKAGRKNTNDEVKENAEKYLLSQKKGWNNGK